MRPLRSCLVKTVHKTMRHNETMNITNAYDTRCLTPTQIFPFCFRHRYGAVFALRTLRCWVVCCSRFCVRAVVVCCSVVCQQHSTSCLVTTQLSEVELAAVYLACLGARDPLPENQVKLCGKSVVVYVTNSMNRIRIGFIDIWNKPLQFSVRHFVCLDRLDSAFYAARITWRRSENTVRHTTQQKNGIQSACACGSTASGTVKVASCLALSELCRWIVWAWQWCECFKV